MAANSQDMIVYRILSYLRRCLDEGRRANMDHLQCRSETFPVEPARWSEIFYFLMKRGYVDGVRHTPVLGNKHGVQVTSDVTITAEGEDYLRNDPGMERAAEVAKTVETHIQYLE